MTKYKRPYVYEPTYTKLKDVMEQLKIESDDKGICTICDLFEEVKKSYNIDKKFGCENCEKEFELVNGEDYDPIKKPLYHKHLEKTECSGKINIKYGLTEKNDKEIIEFKKDKEKDKEKSFDLEKINDEQILIL